MDLRFYGRPVEFALTAEEMRDLDRRASDEFGIPSLLLMENAGRAIHEAAVVLLGGDLPARAAIVAGPGNNGGDGFVAARHLQNSGAYAQVFYSGDRHAARGDALVNIEIAEKMGIDIDYSGDLDRLRQSVEQADLIVDALLGTGIKGEVRSPQAEVIRVVNDSLGPVLAVDIPSGVNADTGDADSAVEADLTVTFAFPKIGLLTGSGPAHVGRLIVADIGIPERALDDAGLRTRILDAAVPRRQLPPRRKDAHKGVFGHVAVVAGSVGMTGAASLTALGALRMGAGLVTVLVPESLNDIMEVKLTEAMTIPVPQGNARAFGMASLDACLELIDQRDAAVIGPGFGRDEDTIAFTLELMRRLNRPAIVDADALYAIATAPGVLKECKAPLVITPHPGEMARLIGTSVGEVQSNRLEVARSFAKEYGAAVVLKGAGTIAVDREGTALINTSGTPGMASGGTGDVLSGMIGSMLARERSVSLDGVGAAVYLHGRAGELAAAVRGEEALIASDVAERIGDAILEAAGEGPE